MVHFKTPDDIQAAIQLISSKLGAGGVVLGVQSPTSSTPACKNEECDALGLVWRDGTPFKFGDLSGISSMRVDANAKIFRLLYSNGMAWIRGEGGIGFARK